MDKNEIRKLKATASALYYQLRHLGVSHDIALAAVVDMVMDTLEQHKTAVGEGEKKEGT